MLVRYRLNSSCTIENFKSDLNAIITGAVTTTADLSSGCDKPNSSVIGTYPTGTYTRVNETTFTYSKAHNVIAGYTHYFRLTFDSTKLTTWDLAQSYTTETDTLVNSSTKTVNIKRFTFDSNYPSGIDIIVSNKCIFIQAMQSGGTMLGIFDLGHSGVTRSYTDSMLMAFQDMRNVINYGANTGVTIPYTYNFDTRSYASNTSVHLTSTPLQKWTSTQQVAILENPVFATSTPNGSTLNLIYALYKIPNTSFAGIQTYKDASNLYRLALNDYSILVD